MFPIALTAGIFGQQSFVDTTSFIFTVDSSIAGASGVNKFRIPSPNSNYRISYWETSDKTTKVGPIDVTSANHEIDFGAAGNYTVAIDPINATDAGGNDFNAFAFADTGDKDKLLTHEQWGVTKWLTVANMFFGCSILTATSALDSPDLSFVTSMSAMFRNASLASPSTASWATDSVTNMSFMFNNATSATPDVSNWVTSSVTNMAGMFQNASSANPDVSNWITSSVTDMSSMFQNATSANPDVSNWITSSVTDMSSMFRGTAQPTTNYDAVLIAWAAQTLQLNVQFHAGTSSYTQGGAAEAARNTLLNTYGWVITDSGGV